jgi:hypothetical protein
MTHFTAIYTFGPNFYSSNMDDDMAQPRGLGSSNIDVAQPSGLGGLGLKPSKILCNGTLDHADPALTTHFTLHLRAAVVAFYHHAHPNAHTHAHTLTTPFNPIWVTELDLSNLRMGDIQFHFLIKGLFRPFSTGRTKNSLLPNLHTLHAANNNLSDLSIARLFQADTFPPLLQFLDLSENAITDQGAILLFDFLLDQLRSGAHTPQAPKGGLALHTLLLRSNFLRHLATTHNPTLASFFSHPLCPLRRLDFRHNSLYDIDLFLHLLKENTSLHFCLFDHGPLIEALAFYSPTHMKAFKHKNTSLALLTLPADQLLQPFTTRPDGPLPYALIQPYGLAISTRPIGPLPYGPIGLALTDDQIALLRKWDRHFSRIQSIRAKTRFHPLHLHSFAYTGHPFYQLLITVLLCNAGFTNGSKLPLHVLVYLLGFLKPESLCV